MKLAKNNKQTQTKVRNKTIIGLKCITIQTADTTFRVRNKTIIGLKSDYGLD